METCIHLKKKAFLEKQIVLENARKILKQEFIGIDKNIDEIIDNLSSWYFLPELQERPFVINLWGLTGVGKTSLIIRLSELINFKDAFYRFDLGLKDSSYSFSETIDDLCEHSDDSPVIIALDEIQHSRTIKGPFRQEISSDKNRLVWELIDSGQIQYFDWKHGLASFEDLISKLYHLNEVGVEVKSGIVVSRMELYCKEMDIEYKEDETINFVPKDQYGKILNFAGDKLGLHLYCDVEKILLSMSASKTIKFLEKILKIAKRPGIKNFTRALIFVMGNLDEAYPMSDNFNADIDADEFHKLSLKITVPKIKKALQERFRNEQIARLGNIHIIYPGLDKNSFRKIIKQELHKYILDLEHSLNLKIKIDPSVYRTIYSEGVYPAQGVRPVFTTINQLFKSKISFFISQIFLENLNIEELLFNVTENKLICNYCKGNKLVHKASTELITNLRNIRLNQKNDLQAITAVHESGHAVLSIALLKTIPDAIFSVTSDAESTGFVYSKFAWEYVTRKELIPRVAMMLGGLVAEEIIFGEENLTNGAGSDIEKATSFLSTMYKDSGMGLVPVKVGIPENDNNQIIHQYEEVELQIKNTIIEAKELAAKVLQEERKLLLALASILADNSFLRKNQIKEIVSENILHPSDMIENGDNLFYKKHLKKQIAEVGLNQKTEQTFENTFVLNRDNKL